MTNSDLAISIHGLSKTYTIVHGAAKRPTFRDLLVERLRAPLKRRQTQVFWALRDISLSIRKGEIVGIIGRNGAGKSTLLKVLSRITEPTAGAIKLYGRVGSLLEVGTGFHPELTGRENIYLNGAILGMARAEIRSQFDAIVSFAAVEEFLDTPVKRYSSGMYVRLAFAVAAHLRTEILVVDEVLAVGDAEFQKRCLGKMNNVAIEGRTVLFVSHNMNAIGQLCKSAVLLENGSVRAAGRDVHHIVQQYLRNTNDDTPATWTNREMTFRNPYFTPARFTVTDDRGAEIGGPVSNDSQIWVQIDGEIGLTDSALNIGYVLFDEQGQLLYWSYQTDMPEEKWPKLESGCYRFRTPLPRRVLNQGTYRLELVACLYCRQWIIQPGVNSPSVFFTIQGGLSDSPYWLFQRSGVLAPVLQWTARPIPTT